MRKATLKPLCLALGLAFVGSAGATTWDMSGSNFYMKFLDGNQKTTSTGSIDTSSGADQGQFTELNLVFKANISPMVEAGGRIQSRSSAAYWTEYGGFGSENAGGGYTADQINHQKFMKLRGAYVELTPGYNWLSMARVGTSDWGMFDPFTMGKIRYIDRDNYNGLYFKGPVGAGTWEFARVSLPEYLGYNFSTGNSPKNQAIYVAQFKQYIGGARLTAGYTYLNNRQIDTTDTNLLDGQSMKDRFKNTIVSLKAEGTVVSGLDVRGTYHHSDFNVDSANVPAAGVWSMTPGASVKGNAYKLDVDWSPAAVNGFTLNYQHFDIGAGYSSVGGARRESDVLLTEGSEGAWYGWGTGATWIGGRANDMQQVAVIQVDNAYTDFDEPGAESVIGWKGDTFKFNYDVANTPMTLELTHVGYNTNWQNYGGNANIYNVGHYQGTYDIYQQNQDRKTNIAVFKLNHNFPVAGGLDLNFKYKHVDDKDNLNAAITTDDRDQKDSGYSLSLGNQLFNHLYGSVSWGKYKRDLSIGGVAFNSDKNIKGLKFAYNLPGFEVGLLAQWITGDGYPNGPTGTSQSFDQYRMKAFAQTNF